MFEWIWEARMIRAVEHARVKIVAEEKRDRQTIIQFLIQARRYDKNRTDL